MHKNQHQNQQLNEGLRYGDLKDFVHHIFTIDQYRSKMGEDKDIVVLGFKVKEKHPAIDLMEFIEKGYKFILDADMSAGEERNGQYQVFVEIERTPNLPMQLEDLLAGISQLCDDIEWKFKYQKTNKNQKFSQEAILETVPVTAESYNQKMLEFKQNDVKGFFDQGITEVELDENNNLTFTKPYAGPVTAKFVAIGEYENVKNIVPGKLDLDETSQGQLFFLTKYLGNYDINKIGNKFLIQNGSKAIVIEKDRW